jgi:hypothetical protein
VSSELDQVVAGEEPVGARRLLRRVGPFLAPAALLIYSLFLGQGGRFASVYGAYLIFLAVFGFQIWVTVSIVRASRRSGFDGRGGRRVVAAGMVAALIVTVAVRAFQEEAGTIAIAFCVPVELSGVLALWHLARRRHFGQRFRVFDTAPYRLFRWALGRKYLGAYTLLLVVMPLAGGIGYLVSSLKLGSSQAVFPVAMIVVFMVVGYFTAFGDMIRHLRRPPTADVRPPVILLRSFDQDLEDFTHLPRSQQPRGWYGLGRSGVNLDAFLATEVTSVLGPLRALGNPAELLPEPGAERTYVHDESWREELVRLVEGAQAVIARAAFSEGLTWELQWIRAAGLQGKLFLLLPPRPAVAPWRSLTTRYFDWLARRVFRLPDPSRSPDQSWSQVVTHLQDLGYTLPGSMPAPGSILAFDDQGRAVTITSGAVTAPEYVAPLAVHLAAGRAASRPAVQAS